MAALQRSDSSISTQDQAKPCQDQIEFHECQFNADAAALQDDMPILLTDQRIPQDHMPILLTDQRMNAILADQAKTFETFRQEFRQEFDKLRTANWRQQQSAGDKQAKQCQVMMDTVERLQAEMKAFHLQDSSGKSKSKDKGTTLKQCADVVKELTAGLTIEMETKFAKYDSDHARQTELLNRAYTDTMDLIEKEMQGAKGHMEKEIQGARDHMEEYGRSMRMEGLQVRAAREAVVRDAREAVVRSMSRERNPAGPAEATRALHQIAVSREELQSIGGPVPLLMGCDPPQPPPPRAS